MTIFGCGSSSKDEAAIVIPITPDHIIESRPEGGPQYSISQIRMHLKEGPFSGTRTIEIDHECVKGPRRIGDDPVIVIQSGPHIRSEHGYQGMGRTDFDIKADFLAPSELTNITTGESEATWPSIRSLQIWLAIRDQDTQGGLRRVSESVKIDLPEMPSSSSGQHPQHDHFGRIASRVEKAVVIDSVTWREGDELLGDGLAVALFVSDPPGRTDGFTLELEFEVENVTRGYSWQLTKRFELKGSAIRPTIMEHDLPEGKEISGEDQLEPQVISCRADS